MLEYGLVGASFSTLGFCIGKEINQRSRKIGLNNQSTIVGTCAALLGTLAFGPDSIAKSLVGDNQAYIMQALFSFGVCIGNAKAIYNQKHK